MSIAGFLILCIAAFCGLVLYNIVKTFLMCCYWSARDTTYVACNFKNGVSLGVKIKALIVVYFSTFGKTIRDRVNGNIRVIS